MVSKWLEGEVKRNPDSLNLYSKIIPSIGFGPFLKAYRELAGLTQVQLAMQVPCHSTLISKSEQGTKTPSAETINAIANALNLNPFDAQILLLASKPRLIGEGKTRKDFGSAIRAFRRKRGMTQTELARLLDYDQSLLSKVEKGKRAIPKRNLIEQLA